MVSLKHYESFFAEGGFLVKIKSEMLKNRLLGEVATEMNPKSQEIAISADIGQRRHSNVQISGRLKEVIGF